GGPPPTRPAGLSGAGGRGALPPGGRARGHRRGELARPEPRGARRGGAPQGAAPRAARERVGAAARPRRGRGAAVGGEGAPLPPVDLAPRRAPARPCRLPALAGRG